MKPIFIFLINTLFFNSILIAQSDIDSIHWETKTYVTKSVNNLFFTFPSSGYVYENRDSYVKECVEAVEANCSLLQLTKYEDVIDFKFFNSRQEKNNYMHKKSRGTAVPYNKTVYVVAEENLSPPIRHELMHLMAINTWGWHNNLNWLNEGLAAYAENDCNNYNVAQIYRYFIDNKMLISMDSLVNDFYVQPEMIGYHQSAYIVEYLITNFGIEKLTKLWHLGYDEFEKIYGVPFSIMEADIIKSVKEKYPISPDINWNVFKEGCK